MTPKTNEQYALIRQNRKQEILHTALKLFANNGFESTNISSIAKEVGISKGLIYNYFESKEQLLLEVVELVFVKLGEGFTLLLGYQPGKDDPKETFRYLMVFFQKSLTTNRDFWLLYSRFSFQLPHYKNMVEQLEKEEKRWNDALGTVLKDLGFVTHKLETIKLNSLMDGIALNYILRPHSYPLDSMLEHIIKNYTS